MVRSRFQPHDGVRFLSTQEMATASHDFLIPALNERASHGPIKWDLMVSIAEAGDSVDDPTVLWPADRCEFNAGTLTLHDITPDLRAGSNKINFDPLVLSDGIAPSTDPVLLFRSPSYALSHERRLREQ